MNPLDHMTWEERFYAAMHAVVVMEARALSAEAKLSSHLFGKRRINPLVLSRSRQEFPGVDEYLPKGKGKSRR